MVANWNVTTSVNASRSVLRVAHVRTRCVIALVSLCCVPSCIALFASYRTFALALQARARGIATLTFLLRPHTHTHSLSPCGHAVIEQGDGTGATLGTSTFYNTLIAGLDSLVLLDGETYVSCVTVYNDAGVQSVEVCSNGVLIGQSQVVVSPNSSTTVLLSPVPISAFFANDTNTTEPLNTTIGRPLVSITLPPSSINGSQNLTALEFVTPPTVVLPPLEVDFTFGGYALDLAFIGYPSGYVFNTPVLVSALSLFLGADRCMWRPVCVLECRSRRCRQVWTFWPVMVRPQQLSINSFAVVVPCACH